MYCAAIYEEIYITSEDESDGKIGNYDSHLLHEFLRTRIHCYQQVSMNDSNLTKVTEHSFYSSQILTIRLNYKNTFAKFVIKLVHKRE
jgi:hypothetical protein